MLVTELIDTLVSQTQTRVQSYWDRRGGTQGYQNPELFVRHWEDDTVVSWLTTNGFLNTQPGWYEHCTDGTVVATTRHGNKDLPGGDNDRHSQTELVRFLNLSEQTDDGIPTHTVVPV